MLRNAVNYRPGSRISQCEIQNFASVARNVRVTPPYKFNALLASFESDVASLASQAV